MFQREKVNTLETFGDLVDLRNFILKKMKYEHTPFSIALVEGVYGQQYYRASMSNATINYETLPLTISFGAYVVRVLKGNLRDYKFTEFSISSPNAYRRMSYKFAVFLVEGKYWRMDVVWKSREKVVEIDVLLQQWEYFEDDIEVLLNLPPGDDRNMLWNSIVKYSDEYDDDAERLDVTVYAPIVNY